MAIPSNVMEHYRLTRSILKPREVQKMLLLLNEGQIIEKIKEIAEKLHVKMVEIMKFCTSDEKSIFEKDLKELELREIVFRDPFDYSPATVFSAIAFVVCIDQAMKVLSPALAG
ncbi:MAG: hypothetical protein Q7R98_03230 [Candidatus Jorgensenbacteria bacterium]|nr:hypothetical protein [Candidatus Jorgensenbacteria bacterium]